MADSRSVARQRRPGEDIIDYCVATGRFDADTAAGYLQRRAAGEVTSRTLEVLASALAPGCAVPVSASGAALPTREVRASASGRFQPPPGAEEHYAVNPYVEQAQRDRPTEYRVAASVAPAPTLFESGDLPVFTASGIDPGELLRVPWYARHVVAAARTQAEAAELMEELGGQDGIDAAMAYGYHQHAGNHDYQGRVMEWLSKGANVAAAHAQQQAAKRVAASAAPEKPVGEMTDAEVYEALFGPADVAASAGDVEERAILEGRAVGHYRDVAQVRASVAEREIQAKRGRS